MNIASSPLKIEIADVFVFIKPKHFDLWSEKVEIDAYIEKTLSYLDKFESYITESTQLEQQSPGMMAGLVSKIIDNIQIKITNIYVRIEDTLSIPRMPFALGIVIGSISAETMNDQWQQQYTAGAEVTNKQFSIKDFAVYMNVETTQSDGSGWKAILFDDITADYREKDIDAKYLKFLKKECNFERARDNNYIIERFTLTLRASLNKNVRNRKPQIWANAVLGGEFKGMEHLVQSEFGKYFYFTIKQQQITALMKFLEYVGNYGKFQAGVISKFHKNEMTPEQENDYTKMYLLYKELIDKKDQKQADKLRIEFRDKYERDFAYEKLVLLRTIATKKYEFNLLKHAEESKVQAKIKEIEKQHQGGYMQSMKGFFGFGKKSEQELEEEKLQATILKERLEQEALKNIQSQNQQLVNQISMLKQTGKVTENQLSPEFQELLGTDWAQFEIHVTIPEVHIVLRRSDDKKLVEFIIDHMTSSTQIGLDYQQSSFKLHTFNIKDHSYLITHGKEGPYPYLLENYIPAGDKLADLIAKRAGITTTQLKGKDLTKNAINAYFINNPRIAKCKDGCQMKLSFSSDSQLFLFVNIECLLEVKEMLMNAFAESKDGKALLEYYKGIASEQLFKYVNEGSEFMMTVQETVEQNQKKTHNAVMLDVKLNAPVIFIPERCDTVEGNQVMVLDLGNIKIESSLIDFDPERNYRLINNPILLYDAYNIQLKDMQILGFNKLTDYRNYRELDVIQNAVKIIKDVSWKLSFFTNIEQKHPTRPNYEISVSLEQIGITASDHIFQSLMGVQSSIMAKLAPPSNDQKGSMVSQSLGGGTGRILIEETKPDDDMIFEEKKEDGFEDLMKNNGSQSRRMSVKKPDGISMNVIISIGDLELDILEKVEPEDYDYNILLLDTVQHRELLMIRMSDLIVNYAVDRTSKQNIKLILTHFDVIDKSRVKGPHGEMVPMIPDVYAHIISNPQQNVDRRQTVVMNINQEENAASVGNYFTAEHQYESASQGGVSVGGHFHKSVGVIKRVNSRSNRNSVASNDFQSCLSGASSVETLNYKEIESMSQIYSRIVIEQKRDDLQKIDIDFVFSDFRVVVCFPTFEKLYKYSQKFQPQSPETELNDDDLFSRNMSMVSSSVDYTSLKKNSMVRRATMKFKEELIGKSERRGSLQSGSKQGSMQIVEEPAYQMVEALKHQKIKFSGRFKNVSLWIPQDCKIRNSRVFSFSLMSSVNFRRDQTTLEITDPFTKQLISSEAQSVRDEALVTINQLQMVMINRHLVTYDQFGEGEVSVHIRNSVKEGQLLMDIENQMIPTEKLLEPSRITINYENTAKDAGLKTQMNADVNMEPFEMKIGFREIEFFNKINQIVQEFSKTFVADKPDDNDRATFRDTVSHQSMATDVDIDRKLQHFRRQDMKDLKEQQKQAYGKGDSHTQIRKEEQVQIMKVNFKCDSFRFSLMDDTGLQDYPVVFMNVRDIKFAMKKYEDIDDAAVFILKKMGIIKRKNADEQAFMDAKASLNLEVYYFNMSLQQYEPVLEPWVIQFSMFQEEKYTGDMIQISSPQMLNLNVTFALMETLTKLQKHLSETSEDWQKEEMKHIGSSMPRNSAQNFGIQTTLAGGSMSPKSSEQVVNENQSGYTFINRMKMPCKITIEGYEILEQKRFEVNETFKLKKKSKTENHQSDKESISELQNSLLDISDKDPKAQMRKQTIKKQIAALKSDSIKEVTELSKKGIGIKKFRKSDELFYLIKQIKKAESKTNQNFSLEEEILKINLQIQGQPIIQSIPIELGGVRSFLIKAADQYNIVDESTQLEMSEKKVKKDKSKKMETSEIPVAVLCKINFESQSRKEVEFQSSLLFSNSSMFDIIIMSRKDPKAQPLIQQVGKKTVEKDPDFFDFEELIIDKNHVRAQSIISIEPGQVFHIPLSWFIKEKSIYVQKKSGHFHLLFPNIRKYFGPSNLEGHDFEKLKPHNIEVLGEEGVSNFVSVNLSLFKCKPTTLNLPGQYLITFTPPICVCNYLFNDIQLLRNETEVIGTAESKGFFYINDMKFDQLEHGLGSMMPVRWRFTDEQSGFYLSQNQDPLFVPKKANKKGDLFSSTTSQIKLKAQNRDEQLMSSMMIKEENKHDDSEEITIEDECVLNLELLPFNVLVNEYDNFELRDKVFEKTAAVMLQVYPQFMVVNQTDVDIAIQTLAEGVSKDKDRVILVKAHQNQFFFSTSYKAQIKVQGYQWSKVFDGTTQGLSGLVEVKASNIQEDQDKFLNFGILFSNGQGAYSRTKIIKIVPRYIIYNTLDDDIVIKQKGQSKHIVIKADEKRKVYNFENKEKDPFIKISDGTWAQSFSQSSDMLFQDTSKINEDDWSTAFSIDDVGDFQVEFSSAYSKLIDKVMRTTNRATGSINVQRVRAWHTPNDNNFFKRILRVTVSTQDDATIFIKICKPKFPEYYIYNDTEVAWSFAQLKCPTMDSRVIAPGKRVPFVWYDQLQPVKKLTIFIDGKEKSFVIDKIFSKDITTAKDTYTINVLTTGEVRTIEIRSKSLLKKRFKKKEQGTSILAKMMLSRMMKKESKFQLEMKGVGLSLIDNEPKEILYISIYKFSFLREIWTEQQSKQGQLDGSEIINENITKFDLKIDHIQIDNMLNNVMPVFFCPERELNLDEERKQEDQTPFIQAMITYSEIQDQDVYIRKYRGLQFAIQEMKLQVETGFVNALLKFITQLQAIQNQEIRGGAAMQVNRKTGKQGLGSTITQNVKKREQICPSLKAELPELNQELSKTNEKKIFFELIHLGAIKLKITMRFEKKALELGNISQGLGIANVLQIVFTTVATISDSPMRFKEVIIMNTYTTQENLIDMLTRNFAKQGVMQFYKLLGSSDLIGNPVGLIDKLGTGVFEFLNEPRKGLIKGPKEFVGGVGKGVKSLVTNVVSGGMDSVSKITGSLYGVLKNVSGDEVNEEQMALKRPEDAFDGVYKGLKGGAAELVHGVTGLFTKPYQMAKKEGTFGFVKGVGSGFIGVLASPFAATMRLGNNISTGIKNSAIRIGKGKLPTYGRFRHPRYFNSKNILQPYDEAISEANEILKTIKHGRFAHSTIRFFADFSKKTGKHAHNGILIVTDSQLLYVEDFKTLKFNLPLSSISKVEVFEEKVIRKKVKKLEARIDEDKIEKEIETLQKADAKERLRYHIIIKSRVNLINVVGNVGAISHELVYKLETENYPVIDKVYSVLSK